MPLPDERRMIGAIVVATFAATLGTFSLTANQGFIVSAAVIAASVAIFAATQASGATAAKEQ